MAKTSGIIMTSAVIECILSRCTAKCHDPAATLSDDQIRELVFWTSCRPVRRGHVTAVTHWPLAAIIRQYHDAMYERMLPAAMGA
jgi:hypothetical protein